MCNENYLDTRFPTESDKHESNIVLLYIYT